MVVATGVFTLYRERRMTRTIESVPVPLRTSK
jgi:hypothetical protein